MLRMRCAFALRVSTQWIIFEGSARSQVINLINDSEEEQTYRISWQNFRMGEDVMLEEVKEDQLGDLKIAEPYLKYAPRRITVPAGASQQLRIMARIPSDLPDGEYRSHMNIAPEPKQPVLSAEEELRSQSQPVVKIATLTGISFPVIIRKGKLAVQARFENPSFQHTEEGLKLSIDLLRDGSRSLFGDVDFICIAGGQEIVARQVRGLPVYPEVAKRRLQFDIPYPEGGVSACASMKIVYRAESEDSQYRGGEIASISISLQP